MTPSEIKVIVEGLPHMNLYRGQYIYNFLIEKKSVNCLELGFYHGVSSLYIGAAMKANNGKLTTIDLEKAKDRKPNIEELIEKANLQEYIQPYYEHKSYTWRMMKMLQEGKHESFDFCYIDGGHTWDDTGFAFFLVSMLLKPNGWVLFDDLLWSIDKSNRYANKKDTIPLEERTMMQVGMVYELLVKTDKRYSNFFSPIGLPNWGFAQKIYS